MSLDYSYCNGKDCPIATQCQRYIKHYQIHDIRYIWYIAECFKQAKNKVTCPNYEIKK